MPTLYLNKINGFPSQLDQCPSYRHAMIEIAFLVIVMYTYISFDFMPTLYLNKINGFPSQLDQ
jgi:hypothetical protein